MTTKKPLPESESVSVQQACPDVALIAGVTPDGEGLQILRARDNRVEFGALRPLREGTPITGEVVTLRPRANFPALCDVETHYKPSEPVASVTARLPEALRGPAQVATDEYRRNWDAIWSAPSEKSNRLN